MYTYCIFLSFLSADIPNFLSNEECREFIDAGTKLGLNTSGLFGKDIQEELKNKNNSDIGRISDQAWIKEKNVSPKLWTSLFKRYVSSIMLISQLRRIKSFFVE